MRVKVNINGLKQRMRDFKNITRRVMRYYGRPITEFVRGRLPVDTGAANVATEQIVSERKPNEFVIVVRPKKQVYADLYSRRMRSRVDRRPSVYWFVVVKRRGIDSLSRYEWQRYMPLVKRSLRMAVNGVYGVVTIQTQSAKVKLNRYRQNLRKRRNRTVRRH